MKDNKAQSQEMNYCRSDLSYILPLDMGGWKFFLALFCLASLLHPSGILVITFPRYLACSIQGRGFPSSNRGSGMNLLGFFEHIIPFVLLLAGSGCLLNTMLCSSTSLCAISSISWRPLLDGLKKKRSSAYPKQPA